MVLEIGSPVKEKAEGFQTTVSAKFAETVTQSFDA